MEIRNKALGLLTSAYKACRSTVVEAIQAVVEGFTWLYGWHQRLMRTHPDYPIALLTIGKSIVRIVTPSSAVAAATIALVAAILHLQQQDPDDEWHGYF
jgi:hypothetical protein